MNGDTEVPPKCPECDTEMVKPPVAGMFQGPDAPIVHAEPQWQCPACEHARRNGRTERLT